MKQSTDFLIKLAWEASPEFLHRMLGQYSKDLTPSTLSPQKSLASFLEKSLGIPQTLARAAFGKGHPAEPTSNTSWLAGNSVRKLIPDPFLDGIEKVRPGWKDYERALRDSSIDPRSVSQPLALGRKREGPMLSNASKSKGLLGKLLALVRRR